MKRAIVAGFCAALFVLGAGSLALTLYLWLGDWPQSLEEAAVYARSVAETEGRPPEPLVAHPRARAHQNLGGTWNALIDPGRWGENPITLGALPRNARPDDASALVEFSFEDGLTLEVPGDWNTQDERLFFYEGVVWYRRIFDAAPQPGRRSFLHFGAANYRATVTLNGRRIGEHAGGFTPFVFEVTDHLREGRNQLVVGVDNEVTDFDVPTPRTDWLNYGGLTRDVLLLDLPELFVRDYGLRLADDADDALVGFVQVDPARAGVDVAIAVPALGVEAKARTDATGRAELRLAARPGLWSPGSPTLYEVEFRGGDDAVRDRVGFRRIEARGTEILLNGEPLFLRGISVHEEAPDGAGRARTEAHARTLLGWARDLECNFVRLAHYPHNDHMARVADEMGLLVWAEIPVYWNIAFDEPRTLEIAKQQLSELIARDRNRPSVVFWSIGNETPAGEARDAFMAALAEHVRALDPTRLVTAAMLTGPEMVVEVIGLNAVPAALGLSPDEWVVPIDDGLGEIVDVPAINQYFGWYYAAALALGTPLSWHESRQLIADHFDRIRFEISVEKPVIVSEFGAGAKLGLRAPEAELVTFSEDYQALVYRLQVAMLARQDQIAGLSPWILKDFRSALRMYQGVQDYWNLKGLVADDGTRKLAFDVLRDHYRERREAGAR